MFRRGDVEALRATARLSIPAAQAEEFTADNISLADAWKKAGVSTSDLLAHRVELRFVSGGKLKAGRSEEASSPVSWDAKAGLYTVDAPAILHTVVLETFVSGQQAFSGGIR